MTKPTTPPLGEFERIARFFAPLAGPGTGLTSRHVSALEALVTEGSAGARMALPGGVLVRIGRGRIFFETSGRD